MQCMVLFLNEMKQPFKHQLIKQKWCNDNFRFEINTFIAQHSFLHRTRTFNMPISTRGHGCSKFQEVRNFFRAQHFKKINNNFRWRNCDSTSSIMKHRWLLQHWLAGNGVYIGKVFHSCKSQIILFFSFSVISMKK